jgi:hypothetical protein
LEIGIDWHKKARKEILSGKKSREKQRKRWN